MIEYIMLIVAGILASVIVKGQVHCGRIVVSGSWDFCPFCGKSLTETKASLAAARARKKALDKAVQTRVVPLASMIPTQIAGKTHFLAPSKTDLRMSDQLPSPCPHRASRGKPKGKNCRLFAGHEGRHRYGK